MLCPHCGTEVGGDLKLCSHCKSRLGQDSSDAVNRRQTRYREHSGMVKTPSSQNLPITPPRDSWHPRKKSETIAGLGFRTVAHAFDFALVSLLTIACNEVVLEPHFGISLTEQTLSHFYLGQASFQLHLSSTLLLFIFSYFVIGSFYFTCFESSSLSATPGKFLLGIYSVSQDGQSMGVMQSLTRHLSRIFCCMTFGLGYLLPLAGKRALHDELSGCIVLQRTDSGPRRMFLGLTLSLLSTVVVFAEVEREVRAQVLPTDKALQNSTLEPALPLDAAFQPESPPTKDA